MAASIMGDASVTLGCKKEHLVLKSIGAQRPAVTEDNRLTCTPIIVVNLRSVLGSNRAHALIVISLCFCTHLHSGLGIALIGSSNQFSVDCRICTLAKALHTTRLLRWGEI